MNSPNQLNAQSNWTHIAIVAELEMNEQTIYTAILQAISLYE